ncbi:hypothetical protein KSP35_15545 [Aquihabitans sp. G128]|uniref:hypothetical protein n=1 Tax=Aquihabitans sp. G128 TaxID=2849779 RepID=UPI001C22B937|nr:hypothetical protein [Aquihabitans sp. G128]QXC59785.1 hypothetical protein KSP35_15545 [Aquihabitans sp. G128]
MVAALVVLGAVFAIVVSSSPSDDAPPPVSIAVPTFDPTPDPTSTTVSPEQVAAASLARCQVISGLLPAALATSAAIDGPALIAQPGIPDRATDEGSCIWTAPGGSIVVGLLRWPNAGLALATAATLEVVSSRRRARRHQAPGGDAPGSPGAARPLAGRLRRRVHRPRGAGGLR